MLLFFYLAVSSKVIREHVSDEPFFRIFQIGASRSSPLQLVFCKETVLNLIGKLTGNFCDEFLLQ